MASLRIRVLCVPDLTKPIGGVKQLHRLVEVLAGLGHDAAIVCQQEGFRPGWFSSTAPCRSLANCEQAGDFTQPDTVLVVPETYLAVNWDAFHGHDLSQLPRVVYNQNAYYTYGAAAEPLEALQRFYDGPEVLQVLCVSDDSHRFLLQHLGLTDERASRVVHALEPYVQPGEKRHNRIAWLPRKHPQEARAMLLGLQRRQLQHLQGWQAQPLDNLDHQQLMAALAEARIFLSFGHPEGFGLPVAEAMAAGCYVVGYSGGGAEELFRLGLQPAVALGDWSSYLAAVEQALRELALEPRRTAQRLERQSLAVRQLYSAEQERLTVAAAIDRVTAALHTWLQR